MNDIRDRSQEFFQAVQGLLPAADNGGLDHSSHALLGRDGTTGFDVRANQNGGASSSGPKKHHRTSSSQTRFAKAAGTIMHGIHAVSAKLEKLTALAKQKSLFKDPTRDIQQLRFVIKEEITRLSEDIQHLQNYMEGQDSKGHSRNHSTAVVKDLQVKLAQTTNDFRGILELRTKSLQAQASRRKRYGDSSNFSLRKREVNSFGRSEAEGKSHSQILVQEQKQSRVNEEYLSSRAETVQDIEKMLSELGGIYERMLTMVKSQGEVAISIESNMQIATENVDSGIGELKTLLNSMQSNRWLIIKVFFILILFAVFFTVFVA
mmetsp:Transcript_31189/g.76093  ORF Transcript_31189/g.76093 Transcript_31189/m.76093 type:complete len:320 (-) Transcript_31189:170-1129(-)